MDTSSNPRPVPTSRRPQALRALLAWTIATAVAAPPLAAVAADSDPLDLDPNHQAMVARQKIKDRGQSRRSDARLAQGRNGGGDDKCGSVDIGNNNNADRSARNRVNPRDTTVIVTGPVINSARCR